MNEAKIQARLIEQLAALASRSAYVCAHDYESKEVGTRLMAISDLKAEFERAADLLKEILESGDREPEAKPNDEPIASSAAAPLLAAFDDALNQNHFLWIEIGYTRPTDWMVHVWDRTRKTDDDSTIITTQSTDRETACQEATQKLRDYLARGGS